MASTPQGVRQAPALAVRAGAPRAPRLIQDRGLGWITTLVCWAMFLVLSLPEGLNYATLGVKEDAGQGSVITKLIWLGMLGLSLLVIGARWQVVRKLLPYVNPFMLFFAALATLSLAWSIDRPMTMLRVLRVVVITLAALALVVTDWHPDRFQQLFRRIFLAFLGGSIVFGILRPDLAIHQELAYELVGAWRGLTNHKNGFGNLATIGLVFWMHGLVSRRIGMGKALLGILICLLCVKLSRSSTSIAMSGVVIMVSLLLTKLPPRAARRVPVIVWGLALLVLLYAMALLQIIPGKSILFAPITIITGKNLTFTGRSDIWDVILAHIRMRPLLGNGYGGYWYAGPEGGTESYVVYLALQTFYPTQAHNGYLDVFNDLGLVGLVSLIGYLIHHVRQSVALFRQRPLQSVFYVVFFFQQALANFTESHWWNVRSVNFVIMTFATFALARESLEAALERKRVLAARQPSAPARRQLP